MTHFIHCVILVRVKIPCFGKEGKGALSRTGTHQNEDRAGGPVQFKTTCIYLFAIYQLRINCLKFTFNETHEM